MSRKREQILNGRMKNNKPIKEESIENMKNRMKKKIIKIGRRRTTKH